LDPLTQAVALLRPAGLLWKPSRLSGDWAVRFPAHRAAVFCAVTSGSCRLSLPGYASWLEAGDFLLLVAPPAWILAGGGPAPVVDFRPDHHATGERLVGPADGAPELRLLGGLFAFGDSNAALLDSVLPPITHIRAADRAASRLSAVLGLLGDEAGADRPGRALVVAKLLEIMLVEAIRFDGAPIGLARPGLLAGLADARLAAALHALHGDIRRGWTVAALAELSGLSRSVFAERFGRVVGQPPIDYLLHWRVALAKDALRFGGKRPAEIAFDCGYQSYSAFSTAFRRVVGCSPGRWAQNTGRL